jgi:hypothetical protein
MKLRMIGLLGLTAFSGFAAERINHEGRILGPQLSVTTSTLFNTAAADAVIASMQIMPVTSAWNEDISKRPLLPNSDAMISRIISDLDSNKRTLRVFFEMNYVLVPDAQPLVPIDFVSYPDESDPSPYPIPTNMPIETWPRETGALTLNEWQLDVNSDGGDRHSIVVQPTAGFIWETWQALKHTDGTWEASNGAKFDLKSNTLRPLTWTSADAAGLPMFPALVKYDECQRGMVEHAMRIVVKKSRKEFIYPATHYASTNAASLTNIPAMGQRVRLKESYVIPANWTTPEKAVLKGLKKYGALVADNGNFFSISAVPDDRWAATEFNHLSSISITNFEVIQTTGAAEGPRSPGAPIAHAGIDQTATTDVPLALKSYVESSYAPTVHWSVYSGAGPAMVSNASSTNATVTFTAPGNYVLLLSADDGVHAVAYDVIHVSVANGISASITPSGSAGNITWSGSTAPHVIEQAISLNSPQWLPIATNTTHSLTIQFTNQMAFYRIREQ